MTTAGKTFDLDSALALYVVERFPKAKTLARRRRHAELRRAYNDGDPKVRNKVDTFAKKAMVAGDIQPVSTFTIGPPARPGADEIGDAIKALTLLTLPDGTPEQRVTRARQLSENYGPPNEVTMIIDDYIRDPEAAVARWL